jgi:hypothetical protein
MQVHQEVIDSTIETIARLKANVFQRVASNLSRIMHPAVPYTKESCEAHYKKLTSQGLTVPADPFQAKVNDLGFDSKKVERETQRIREREENSRIEKEIAQAKLIVDEERGKVTRALQAKRKAEIDAEQAQILVNAAEAAAKKKIASANRKRKAAGLGLFIDVLDSKRPVYGATPKRDSMIHSPVSPFDMSPHAHSPHVNSPHSAVNSSFAGDSGADSPSPSVRKDKRKNIGVNKKDPRSHLTVNELEALCSERILPKTGSKAEIINRLNQHDERLTDEEIVARIPANRSDLSVPADRSVFLERLKWIDAEVSGWGKRTRAVFHDDITPGTPTKLHFQNVTTGEFHELVHSSEKNKTANSEGSTPKKAKIARVNDNGELVEV